LKSKQERLSPEIFSESLSFDEKRGESMKLSLHLPIRKRGAFVLFCIGLFVLLVLAVILAVFSGSVSIPPDVVCKVLLNHLTGHEIFEPTWNASLETIIWTMRFPRVLMATIKSRRRFTG
jgi:hypothetical protein